MKLFGRRANLIFKPETGLSKDVSGLRVVFQITKSNDATANSAEIVVYNLAQETIVFFKKSRTRLLLSAGYDEGGNNPQLKGIFSGEIYHDSTVNQGGDIVTKFQTADSARILQETRVNKSFKSGTSVEAVVDSIIKQLGVAKGSVVGLQGKAFTSGYAASGSAQTQLDILALKTNTVWSIQDGVLQFVPALGYVEGTIPFLTPETGLLGSPNQRLLKINGVDRSGIEAICLLQPDIKPGGRVKIESQNVKGTYTVQKVTHRGDTESGPWFSEIEAI